VATAIVPVGPVLVQPSTHEAAEDNLMEQLLLELLVRLEAVGDRDESLFDTVVRERMGNAVFFGFIKPRPGFVLPDDYGMPDEENRTIKAALGAYIEGARALAPAAGLDTFHERLAAFQNLAVRTAEQKNDYDDFFGWSNPELFDEAGNVRPRL
jgi:hypothetical protein